MTKILVIEDEQAVRENIIELLQAEDFETIAAPSGKIGIQLANSDIPDLILCDLMMPEVDGYDVLSTLRQQVATATIPFIFLTARSTKADFRQGMEMGADDYLTKPFTRAEILSAVISRLQKQAALKKYLSAKKESNIFSSEMRIIELSLRNVLERKNFQEFQVHYQPQIDISSGEIIAAEGLVRWQSPELGLVSPAELVPLAESTGLIIPIGDWILKTVCKQLKSWHTAGFPWLRVAVNLSIHQFCQPDFCEKLVELLAVNDLSPDFLELELTESMIMQDLNQAIATMSQLQSYGIKIAIDDFGMGSSCLLYLKQLTIDTLKIDRYYIHNIDQDYQKAAITNALIQMAHDLNLNVVAEGVETEAELDFLRKHKCNAMQGFLFSPALPITEFEKLLIGEHRLTEVIN